MVRELFYMGRQHGKWEGEESPDNERLLTREDLEVLERMLCVRVRDAATDGSIWTSARLVGLLGAWREWGDANEMRNAVAERLQDDGEVLKFIARFVTHVHSHRVTDRVPRISLRLDPDALAGFVDVDIIAQRIDGLKRPGLSAEERAVVKAFSAGRKARAAGKDPRRVDDDLDS